MTGTTRNRTNLKDVRTKGFLGPGTVATIIAILLFVGFQMLIPTAVKIEKSVAITGGLDIRKPSVFDLRSWSSELKLTRKQSEALGKLAERKDLEYAVITAQLHSEMKHFDESVKSGNLHSIEAIQSAAQPLSMLGQRKRAIEQNYAAMGFKLLDPGQRQVALQLWHASRAAGNSGGRATSNR